MSTFWSSDNLVPNARQPYGTSGPPALAVYRNQLYCLREGRGNNGWLWVTVFNGISWSADIKVRTTTGECGTTGPPALAVYRDKLYCLHEGQGKDGWLWCTIFDGTSWSADAKIGTAAGNCGTSGPPALAVYRDQLYCLREGRDKDGWLWAVTFNGNGWSEDKQVRRGDSRYGTAGPPALAVYRDQLYCLHEGRNKDGWLWATTFNGSGWSADERVKRGNTYYGMSGPPALAVFQNTLYCVREGRDDDGRLWCTTFDGSGWSADEAIQTADRQYGTAGTPALAVFNEVLFCAHEGSNGSGWLWLGQGFSAGPANKPSVSDAQKLDFITQLAPYTYLAQGEKYFPSTVEFAFANMKRVKEDGNYWIVTKEALKEPSSVLPYFGGDLNTAKVYAFWVEKDYGISEITYFFFYPYNRGKEVANTVWGNHVGDWEHATIRLGWTCPRGQWTLAPFDVYLSQHSGGEQTGWLGLPKANGTSVIIYSAWGSHGLYFTPGRHVYQKTLGLADECSAGSVFNTSTNVIAFDYAKKAGLNNQPWPRWMSKEYSQPGPGPDPARPDNGPIYRWGNPQRGCLAGQCRLEDGPTGPIDKNEVWERNKFER